MNQRPSGILVPLVTPFTDSGDLAPGDLEKLAHRVVDEGASGIVALGTTAEAAALDPRERGEVVRICASVCRDRGVPLLVGVGSNDTAGTVRAAAELGENPDVAGLLVVVPYYSRPGEAGAVAHFEHVADRTPLPVVVYNVPYRTGQHLGAESLLRLSRHPRIVGVKQAVGVVDTDTARVVAGAAPGFSVLAGEDTLVSPMLAMGAAGAILATANVYPRPFADLFDLWRSGRVDEARALGNRLVEPAAELMAGPNPTVVKAALHAQGVISTPCVRLPLLPAAAPPRLLVSTP